MPGGFTPMADSRKVKIILQAAAEGLMKKNVMPESCSKLIFC
ncbi:hypothetical protein [Phascolarctobacterium succinatutens]|nr:hypothetical protein [Phascolarctobacterium succinatutens]